MLSYVYTHINLIFIMKQCVNIIYAQNIHKIFVYFGYIIFCAFVI